MALRATQTKMDQLPQDCAIKILSFTSPLDVCRFATLSSYCRSSVNSDDVWEAFLPQDYKSTLDRSSNSSLEELYSSKKELYLHLTENPLLIDGGLRSVQLVKSTGNIRYTLSPRDLHIAWGDNQEHWAWIPNSNSRFSEVPKLFWVCWLEIGGKIRGRALSRGVLYAVYFIFEFTGNSYGWEDVPVELSVGIVGREALTKKVSLPVRSHRRSVRRRLLRNDLSRETKVRRDKLLEAEMGGFFSDFECENEEVEMWVRETKVLGSKTGLVVHGIEIRPKGCQS